MRSMAFGLILVLFAGCCTTNDSGDEPQACDQQQNCDEQDELQQQQKQELQGMNDLMRFGF